MPPRKKYLEIASLAKAYGEICREMMLAGSRIAIDASKKKFLNFVYDKLKRRHVSSIIINRHRQYSSGEVIFLGAKIGVALSF